MKKRPNERTVIFLKDYTNKQKDLILKCDAIMASHLIQIGIAEFHEQSFEIPEKATKKVITVKKTKKK